MTARDRARRSLEGLSTGDAFGELFFTRASNGTSAADLPPGPWPWTDDTHMALSIVEVLDRYSQVDQDALAAAFARRFAADPSRGYGAGTGALLQKILDGADWRAASPALFNGGSFGNGAAMRAAPIGGFFHGDPGRAAAEAQRSAVITHAHPEGQAGAMAVAVGAAVAAGETPPTGREFLRAVSRFVPDGPTRHRIELAMEIPAERVSDAIEHLGTGQQVSAPDTVPFCLWIAAYHLDQYDTALWQTVSGGGDCDTTCAIVGGIVALSAAQVPAEWLRRRERLPDLHL